MTCQTCIFWSGIQGFCYYKGVYTVPDDTCPSWKKSLRSEDLAQAPERTKLIKLWDEK